MECSQLFFQDMHEKLWYITVNTGENTDPGNRCNRIWHQEQNLPVVVLISTNLFKRVVSAL